MPIPFSSVHAETPSYESLLAAYEQILSALSQATDESAAVAAVDQWEQVRRNYETWSSLVELHFEQDTTNTQYQQARQARDELTPRFTDLEVRCKRLLLEEDRRRLYGPLLGQQAFALWEADVLSFAPVIQDDLVAESTLEAEYTELCGGARLAFDGGEYNLSSITKFLQQSDRGVRHAAEQVRWNWCQDNGEALDEVFDKLVKLRHQIATKLGFATFIELAYKRMNRVDYTHADVERFRDQVREHVVPLCSKLYAEQAERLGVDPLMVWDEPLYDRHDNPLPQGGHDWMLERAKEMFDAMGPLGSFFRMLADGGYLDLKIRDGKAPGGFCTWFPNYGMPFIFANFNGTKGDVEVFTHEVGHAFQGYSSRDFKLSEYHWPTYESCEIHSMGLEFLTWPHMEKFFGDEADRFRRIHLTQSLQFLPYGVAVDHFQHRVYAAPDATPADRHAMWRQMEQTYLPWRNWGDLAYGAKGGRWQLQRHIYTAPFYYIDYTLALTCALQFWRRSERNAPQALDDYLALCRRGGSLPFGELVAATGLESPFKPGTLASIVEGIA